MAKKLWKKNQIKTNLKDLLQVNNKRLYSKISCMRWIPLFPLLFVSISRKNSNQTRCNIF